MVCRWEQISPRRRWIANGQRFAFRTSRHSTGQMARSLPRRKASFCRTSSATTGTATSVGESRTREPDFLDKNPKGRLACVILDSTSHWNTGLLTGNWKLSLENCFLCFALFKVLTLFFAVLMTFGSKTRKWTRKFRLRSNSSCLSANRSSWDLDDPWSRTNLVEHSCL